MSIDPDTSVGPVSLTVRDLDGTREFYERVVGLRALDREGSVATLAGEDGRSLVELVRDPTRRHGRSGRRASSTWRSSSPTGRSWRARCDA